MKMTVTETATNLKCVVVGDGGVGKSSMLLRFCSGRFKDDYTPTCFDNYTVGMEIQDKYINLNLMDTAGQETYDRLRTLSYFNADVFIVCFSLVDQDSYVNVKSRWIPELKEFKPGIPLILVGTKQDLREEDTNNTDYTSYFKGKRLSRKVGAVGYVECSAITENGLNEVFRKVLMSALGIRKRKPFWKSIKTLFRFKKLTTK